MSQHPSLRSSDKGRQHRSVLKRYEKLKILKDKEKWDEKDSVFGLAKVRVIKFKIKKEKAAAVEGEAAPAEGAAPAGAGTAKAPAQGAAASKGATAAKGAPAQKTAPGGKAAPEGKKETK